MRDACWIVVLSREGPPCLAMYAANASRTLEKSTGVPTRTHPPFDIVVGLSDTDSQDVDAGTENPATDDQHHPRVQLPASR